jgi:nitrite reductase/ring-hydroxylating ferredoxin subunit
MSLVRAGSAASLPPGEMREATLNGTPYVICNVNGEFYAINGTCPHRGAPLAHGALHGHIVVCPWHAWEFDCRTGEYDYDSSIRIEKYPVKIEGGEILIDLSESPSHAGTPGS